MKKMTKCAALVMALLLALSLMTVTAFAEETTEEQTGGRMPIGSTPYTIEVPEGFYDAGVTQDDIADDMISTYVSDDVAFAFDVYEFDKSEAYPTLQAFAEADCAAYNGTDLDMSLRINGVTLACYSSADEYEGVTYKDRNYAFEYEDKIVQIDFYWQDDALDGMAEEIMSTFQMSGVQQISVGISGYSIMIPKEFEATELSDDDWDIGLLSAYSNFYSGLEIETRYFSNETGASLAEIAAAQCEAYNGTMLDETEINGIPMAEYVARQTYDGVEYQVYVVLVESFDGGVSAVDFYLNNWCGYVQAEAYMHTLSEYDESKNVPLEATYLHLGSSGYRVKLPCGFISGIVPLEDFQSDGLIATYTSPHSEIALDVYQCLKADEESSELATFTEIDAAKYAGTEIDLAAELNGIPATVYRSQETYDDITYDCLSYTFEAQDIYFVQVCFYWIGDDLTEDVEEIMNTLELSETKDVVFGRNNDFLMTVPADTEVEVVIDEEGAVDTVYMSSSSGTPTIVIYEQLNPDNLSLEAFAQQCCAERDATGYGIGENANGITVANCHYDFTDPATEEGSGIFYDFIEKDGVIYEIDLVLNDYAQLALGQQILTTMRAA